MLKGGLVYADYITTVSDTYAQEIQTEYYGEGLNGLLSARHFDMQGIVNGIDYTTYNPQTDSKIYMNYDASSFRKKKYVNKERLQEELGLDVDRKKYMIGLISRLTDQKGLDLINAVMDGLVDEFTQLVVIGTGEPQYENMFRHYAWKYPNRVSANICYSDDLAHKLYAAADAFLMPSRFEPCGLTQMISFRYGTVPIVRETGGLKDTVQAYNEYDNSGDGFSFANYNADEMLQVINYSKHIFYDRKRQWNQMVDRVDVTTVNGTTKVTYYAKDYAEQTQVEAVYTDPDGKTHQAKLTASAPGTYEAQLDTTVSGVYNLSVQRKNGKKIENALTTAAVVQYSQEYKFALTNDSFCAFIKQYGKMLSPKKNVWKKLKASGRARVCLTNSLLILLLFVFLADIAMRRFAYVPPMPHWTRPAKKAIMTKEKTAEDGQPEPEAEKPMEKIKKTKPEETASQALDTSALLKKKEKRNHSV